MQSWKTENMFSNRKSEQYRINGQNDSMVLPVVIERVKRPAKPIHKATKPLSYLTTDGEEFSI
jgi:hypothetical protein